MFRMLFYGLIIFFVWRVVKSIFPGEPTEPTVEAKKKENIKDSKINIDKRNIDDANFKDID